MPSEMLPTPPAAALASIASISIGVARNMPVSKAL